MPFKITLTLENSGPDQQYSREIEAPPINPKDCTEAQLSEILVAVLSLLEQAREEGGKFYAMRYEAIDDSGQANADYNIYEYIAQAVEFENLHTQMLDYTNRTYNEKKGERFWDNSEHQAGTEGIKPLATRYTKYISTYIEFLYTNDLDHEVAQCGDIADIVNAHDWCEETLRLMVARATSCCGQHGYDDFHDNYVNEAPSGIAVKGLKDYILLNVELFFKCLQQEKFVEHIDIDDDKFEWDSYSNKWLVAVYKDLNDSDQKTLMNMIEGEFSPVK